MKYVLLIYSNPQGPAGLGRPLEAERGAGPRAYTELTETWTPRAAHSRPRRARAGVAGGVFAQAGPVTTDGPPRRGEGVPGRRLPTGARAWSGRWSTPPGFPRRVRPSGRCVRRSRGERPPTWRRLTGSGGPSRLRLARAGRRRLSLALPQALQERLDPPLVVLESLRKSKSSVLEISIRRSPRRPTRICSRSSRIRRVQLQHALLRCAGAGRYRGRPAWRVPAERTLPGTTHPAGAVSAPGAAHGARLDRAGGRRRPTSGRRAGCDLLAEDVVQLVLLDRLRQQPGDRPSLSIDLPK